MTLAKEEVSNEMQKVVLQLMDEGGLENVRARTIAKEVGVSVGTIYNFHGSLDGLVERVCSHILKDFASFCQRALEEEAEGFAARIHSEIAEERTEVRELMVRFLHLAEIYINYVETHENRWNAMLAFNRSRREEDISEDYQKEQDDLFGFVSQVLAETQLGKDATLQYHTTRALWSGVHGIVLMSYLGQASPQTRDNTWQQVMLLVRYFVRGLVNQQG